MDTQANKSDIEKNKDVAAVSYVWIFSILILFKRKDSPFVQFHAKQGAVLFVLSVLIWVIPFVRYLNVLVLAAMIIGIIEAVEGNYYRMPFIADIIESKITPSNIGSKLKNAVKYSVNVIIRIFQPNHTTHHERKEEVKSTESLGDIQQKMKEVEENIEREKEIMRELKNKVNEMK